MGLRNPVPPFGRRSMRAGLHGMQMKSGGDLLIVGADTLGRGSILAGTPCESVRVMCRHVLL